MSRIQKEAPMKPFFVGKTFPIAPITTQTTALANDQLLPPSLPPLPPSPRARDISSRRKIHPPGPRRPDRQRGRSRARILPSYHHDDHHRRRRNRCPCKRMLHEAFARRQRLRWTQRPPRPPHRQHPRILFNNHLHHHHHHRCPYRRRCHRYTRGGSGRRRVKKPGYVPETPSVTGEAVGGRQGPLPGKEGDDRGSQESDRERRSLRWGKRAPMHRFVCATVPKVKVACRYNCRFSIAPTTTTTQPRSPRATTNFPGHRHRHHHHHHTAPPQSLTLHQMLCSQRT